MFSGADKEHRAGIVFTIQGKKYAYSLACFMRFFVAHAEKQARLAVKLGTNPTTLNRIDLLWRASQSITVESDSPAQKNANPATDFVINERNITCPHGQNAYVFDEALSAQYPQEIKKDISYIQMARFLDSAQRDDFAIANKIFNIIDDDGELVDDEDLEVLSVLIATLFIAEPKRNPSCFVPSLMLLTLIAEKRENPFGTLYSFNNSLQNELLVMQHNKDKDSYQALTRGIVYPSLVNIPSIVCLVDNLEIFLNDHQKQLFNGLKRYNAKQDQNNIKPSELLMQIGGYFPGSHRYSYSELQYKRAHNLTTLADVKSFIIIADWLKFFLKDQIAYIHAHQLHPNLHPSLDVHKMALMETIIPAIYDSAFTNTALDFSNLTINPSTSSYYPQLLTRFGCRQSKLTADKMANTFFLLHGSPRHGPKSVEDLKKQFTCWSINTGHANNIEEAEAIVNKIYKL